MNKRMDEHQQLILDQFTQQAVPFSQMRHHSPELILSAAGATSADTVLDVACGPGLMACAFAKSVQHVTGIDLTPAMIEQAKKLQQTERLTNVTWDIGNASPLPYADGSYSLVFTRYSFHHFLDPRAVLAEMVRVCRPGGRVVVVDVFTTSPEQADVYNHMEKLRDPSHVRALSLDELTKLFRDFGLQNVTTHFYQHAFALEQVLAGSFPAPGDADRIRRIFADDLTKNELGLGSHVQDGAIHFAYPIVILMGFRSDRDGHDSSR